MRNLVSYIIENSTRLLFFLLLGFSTIVTVQHHAYYRSQWVGSVNSVNGYFFQKRYELKMYLNLEVENAMLVRDNTFLKQQLYNKVTPIPDPELDSLLKSKYVVYKSDVINNSYSDYRNYMTLNIGAKSGVKPDMGVFTSKGVIGIVERTSDNFSSVMSVLNQKTEINAIVKNTNYFGTLKWDGKYYNVMQLIDVPNVAKVKVGDEIVTGGMSAIFPKNIPIGVVYKLEKESNSNYYIIHVKLHADMTNLGHAYVIQNNLRDEIIELESQIVK